jgi:hypothetical protein
MKRSSLIGLLTLSLTVATPVLAQGIRVSDFPTWLQQHQGWLEQQQQRSVAAPVDSDIGARSAVRQRMAAVRASRAKIAAFSRTGHWKSDRLIGERQSWAIQAQQNEDDGTLAAKLTVVGSSLFSHGNISGKLDGNTVSGIVTDKNGTQLATFTGTASTSGMSGSYTTADGDVGSWTVDN